MTDLEGFGTEIGGSGGEGVTYGMGMWATGEGDVARENQKLGGYLV